MCSIIILRRPGHAWPLLLAANRDEMKSRPWDPPGRHWPDRPQVLAGIDRLAGGSWLGVNDDGVVAAVLNREGTLGPAPGLRSRGELVLEALDHADAAAAAEALGALNPDAYRSFNLVVADNTDAFWLCSRGGLRDGNRIEVAAIPPGLSMLTAYDLNDVSTARIAHYLPRFRAAAVPDPAAGDWAAWIDLLASRETAPGGTPADAMCIVTERGFGTVSSALIALPAPGAAKPAGIWLFAAGRPDEAAFEPVNA